MAVRRRRTTPLQDATFHIERAVDKTNELEVKYINSCKGRGVFAKSHFAKGDFVVEYRGTLINFEESVKRRKPYHGRCTVFMFDFCWKDKIWCIDAAQDDGSLGRHVNDDHQHPNWKIKRIINEAKPHLCLFAVRNIQPGEEITYDYGGNDWPWRTQTKDQPHTTKSSESQLSRSAEMTEESPPAPIIQAQDESGLVLIKEIVRTTHFVNYMDIDEGHCTSSFQPTGSSVTWSPSSYCDLTPTEQSTPKLRRTKSIEMKGRLDFDSDELFDPTSDDSGEEYIPKSRQDSSEDTDSSDILTVDPKINKMRFPSKIVDTGIESSSFEELDNTSLKQTSGRGRSPVRKQSKSCRRSSSGEFRPTQTDTLSTKNQTGDHHF